MLIFNMLVAYFQEVVEAIPCKFWVLGTCKKGDFVLARQAHNAQTVLAYLHVSRQISGILLNFLSNFNWKSMVLGFWRPNIIWKLPWNDSGVILAITNRPPKGDRSEGF